MTKQVQAQKLTQQKSTQPYIPSGDEMKRIAEEHYYRDREEPQWEPSAEDEAFLDRFFAEQNMTL